jgi:hypothetical protein
VTNVFAGMGVALDTVAFDESDTLPERLAERVLRVTCNAQDRAVAWMHVDYPRCEL